MEAEREEELEALKKEFTEHLIEHSINIHFVHSLYRGAQLALDDIGQMYHDALREAAEAQAREKKLREYMIEISSRAMNMQTESVRNLVIGIALSDKTESSALNDYVAERIAEFKSQNSQLRDEMDRLTQQLSERDAEMQHITSDSDLKSLKKHLAEAQEAAPGGNANLFQAITEAQSLSNALWKFFREAMDATFSGCDWHGAEIQEKALELGLVRRESYDPKKHAELEFEGEVGDDIYIINKERPGRATLDAYVAERTKEARQLLKEIIDRIPRVIAWRVRAAEKALAVLQGGVDLRKPREEGVQE